MNEKLVLLQKAVIKGNSEAASEEVQAVLDEGVKPDTILQFGLIAGMNEVGRLFEENEYYVPEMMIAARSMKAGLSILKPHLVASGNEAVGTVVIGTVKGDLHDIGKNLVAIMMEGAGFEIVDLGTDVAPEKFVEAAVQAGADIIALSALLTTTLPCMEQIVTAIAEAGLRDQVKIMIGGAPVTSAYAEEIGADGFAPDASRAAKLARQFMA